MQKNIQYQFLNRLVENILLEVAFINTNESETLQLITVDTLKKNEVKFPLHFPSSKHFAQFMIPKADIAKYQKIEKTSII